MEITSKQRSMKNSKVYQWGSLCASVLLAFSSCQKEEMLSVLPTDTNTDKVLSEAIRKGNHAEVVFDASFEEDSELLRSVRFELIQRPGYAGRQQYEDDDYETEYRPSVKLKEDDTTRGIVIIAKKGDANSVHRQYVTFKTVKTEKDGQTKYVLRYNGPITMPKNYKLETSDEWYAMALINYDLGIVDNEGGTGQAIHGRIVERSDMTENRTNIGLATVQPSAGESIYLRSVPFISNWRPVRIETSGHGRVLDFDFKPQGTLVQYDLGSDVSDIQFIRRYGLVSNVLDFSGYYRLSSQDLLNGLASSDAQGWGGMPTWVPDNNDMHQYELYYQDLSEVGLSGGETGFPWHLPVLVSGGQGGSIDATYGARKLTASNLSAKVVDVLPLTGTNYTYKGETTSDKSNGNTFQWIASALGGNMQNARPVKNRRLLLFWGMPRTSVQNPQTYLFADFHDERDIFSADFDYTSFSSRERLAFDYRRTIADLEALGDFDNARSHYESYKPALDRYTTDSAKFYSILPKYIAQNTDRTQHSIVLHQTTAQFQAGRISHAQTVLKTDLLLTEQCYLNINGKNYSTLEVYNATGRSVSLADYALVRLIDNGSYMTYRNPDGNPTDKLSEALILPLAFVNPNKSNPFDGTNFSSIARKGTYTNPSERYHEIYRRPGAYLTTTQGAELGRIELTSSTDMMLAPDQVALLGASGFLQKQYKTDSFNSNWFTDIKDNIDKFVCRYFIAYSDASTSDYQDGTLDFKPGEGFALIKSTGNGTWQVVDATAPIGPNGYAFPAKYDVYKKQFASIQPNEAYSIQRYNGIDFPYIYPFRTSAKTATAWPSKHWVFASKLENSSSGSSLGRRDRFVNSTYNYYGTNFSYKRTPLDPTYTTYKQTIPAK